MKIAVISDIHGNLPALEAVLEDARSQGANQYIFLGDYVFDLHWPNQVIEMVKGIKNSLCVSGNKEIYVKDLETLDQSHWTVDQFSACYWNHRNITNENRDYLYALPERRETDFQGMPFYMAHKPETLLGNTSASALNGISYPDLLEDNPNFSHSDYLLYAKNSVHSDELLNHPTDLPKGIYLFGHYHTQWHVQAGNKLYLNPGSCGLPVDNDPRAAYTILAFDRSEWIVNERRVAYDTAFVAESLRKSSLYKEADIWCEITIFQLQSAREKLSVLFKYIDQLTDENTYPFPNKLWKEAGYRWLETFANYSIYGQTQGETL